MRALGLVLMFGLPGLLLGVALGFVIRRWAVLGLLALGVAVAVRYGAQALGNGPGDNDPRVIWVVALIANLIGFLIGAAGGRLIGEPRHRRDAS